MYSVSFCQFEKHQFSLSCRHAELCIVDTGALSSSSLKMKQAEVYFQKRSSDVDIC